MQFSEAETQMINEIRRLGWKAAQPNHDTKMLKVNSGVTVSHWGLELFL